MKRLFIASSLFGWLVVSQQAYGPQRKSDSARTVPKKSTLSAGAPRPAAAIGNNIVQVIDSLVSAGAAKGKGRYETTKDFDLRMNAISSRHGQLSFLVPPEKTTANFEYDADAGKMKVALASSGRRDLQRYR